MKHRNIHFILLAFLACGCSFLDPLPEGNITDENIDSHPSYIRGLVEKGYKLRPSSYISDEYIYLDAATDDAVTTSSTDGLRRFSTGAASPGSYPFETYWTRDYQGIMYVNMFLKDDVGLNTRYLVDNDDNALLQKYLQGDAYALRAWFEFDLLKKFGGRATDGSLLGVPIVTEPVDVFDADPQGVTRNTYDECVAQILSDCDKALEYLPEANREWLGVHSTIDGASRWQRFDGLSIKALKALVYLQWASPAFNPDGDVQRWKKAAEYAAEVMDFKLKRDGAQTGGFDPTKRFIWLWPNSTEIILTSTWETNSLMEKLFYPDGFRGNGRVGASQNLVDAFPMANSYPIDDPRSGYDPAKPYEGRDPRFYSTVNYNGREVIRPSKTEVMYTFEMAPGEKDEAGGVGNVLTNYYVRKYINPAWNANDNKVDTQPRSIFFYRWAQMCLVFAEAANQAASPTEEMYGFTARQALEYLRKRPTNDNLPGLGTDSDPYLEECAADRDKFAALVRNERRIELCFEGERFNDLRRWSTEEDWQKNINCAVNRAVVPSEAGAEYGAETVETRSFPSQWMPIPYKDATRTSMLQNKGWDSWK